MYIHMGSICTYTYMITVILNNETNCNDSRCSIEIVHDLLE